MFFTTTSTSSDQAQPSSYYVATNGDDNNPGTISKPWRHISYAVRNRAVHPGDTVYIRGGTYHETIYQRVSGSPAMPVTYRNYPGETPIISDTGVPNDWRWLVLDQSYLRIQGLAFSNYSGGAIQVRAIGTDMTGIEIVNCTFEHQQQYSGVAFQAVHITSYLSGHSLRQIIVKDNYFHDLDTGTERGNDSEVLTVSGNVHDVTIIGNYLANVTNIGIDIIGRSSIGQPERVLIKGNTVSGHGSAGLSASGIYLDGAGEYVIVERNAVHDGPFGIVVNLEPGASDLETRHVIIRRNVLCNNGINLKLGVGSWPDNCSDLGKLSNSVAVHNTVFSELDDAPNSYFGCGESLGWKNNIYSHISPGEGVQYQFANETVDPSSWTIDYNYFQSSGGSKYFRWEGKRYDSLTSFQAASGQDKNSLEGDPLFRDVRNKNFHLQEDSPARGSGGPLTTAIGSGSGTDIPVEDTRYFSDGLGLQAGDRIRVGNNDPVTVISVDDGNNMLTVDEAILWQDGTPVNYNFAGEGPNMGAYEDSEFEIFLPLILVS